MSGKSAEALDGGQKQKEAGTRKRPASAERRAHLRAEKRTRLVKLTVPRGRNTDASFSGSVAFLGPRSSRCTGPRWRGLSREYMGEPGETGLG